MTPFRVLHSKYLQYQIPDKEVGQLFREIEI